MTAFSFLGARGAPLAKMADTGVRCNWAGSGSRAAAGGVMRASRCPHQAAVSIEDKGIFGL
ncbi:protein of unknown function [Burkholderia multivorans]